MPFLFSNKMFFSLTSCIDKEKSTALFFAFMYDCEFPSWFSERYPFPPTSFDDFLVVTYFLNDLLKPLLEISPYHYCSGLAPYPLPTPILKHIVGAHSLRLYLFSHQSLKMTFGSGSALLWLTCYRYWLWLDAIMLDFFVLFLKDHVGRLKTLYHWNYLCNSSSFMVFLEEKYIPTVSIDISLAESGALHSSEIRYSMDTYQLRSILFFGWQYEYLRAIMLLDVWSGTSMKHSVLEFSLFTMYLVFALYNSAASWAQELIGKIVLKHSLLGGWQQDCLRALLLFVVLGWTTGYLTMYLPTTFYSSRYSNNIHDSSNCCTDTSLKSIFFTFCNVFCNLWFIGAVLVCSLTTTTYAERIFWACSMKLKHTIGMIFTLTPPHKLALMVVLLCWGEFCCVPLTCKCADIQIWVLTMSISACRLCNTLYWFIYNLLECKLWFLKDSIVGMCHSAVLILHWIWSRHAQGISCFIHILTLHCTYVIFFPFGELYLHIAL